MMESFKNVGLCFEDICCDLVPDLLNYKNSGQAFITFLNNRLMQRLSNIPESIQKVEVPVDFSNNNKIAGGILNTPPLYNLVKEIGGGATVFNFAKNLSENKVTIFYIYDDRAKPAHPSHQLRHANIFYISENARANIVEKFACSSKELQHTNSRWLICSGATLTKYKLITSSFMKSSNHLSSEIVEQDDESCSNLFGFYLSEAKEPANACIKNNIRINLNGNNCYSNINYISFLKDNVAVENNIITKHFNKNCTSKEVFKGVFDNNSTGIYDSVVVVKEGAQNASTLQKNNNILLSQKATVNSNPKLEIFTDQVECSHGSTTGQLDDDALFYLRSRGVSLKQAYGLLLVSFLGEVLENIEDSAVLKSVESNLKKLINP